MRQKIKKNNQESSEKERTEISKQISKEIRSIRKQLKKNQTDTKRDKGGGYKNQGKGQDKLREKMK